MGHGGDVFVLSQTHFIKHNGKGRGIRNVAEILGWARVIQRRSPRERMEVTRDECTFNHENFIKVGPYGLTFGNHGLMIILICKIG